MSKNATLYKILLVGDCCVGKNSILKRYSEGTFERSYKPIIGVDFALKSLNRGPTEIRLQIWNIAGQERFSNMTRVYYRDAHAAVVVYDPVLTTTSFHGAKQWIDDTRSKVKLPNGDDIPIILLANKCDFPGFKVDEIAVGDLCKSLGIIGHFSVSAKENIGIDEAMDFLVDYLMDQGLGDEIDVLKKDQDEGDLEMKPLVSFGRKNELRD